MVAPADEVVRLAEEGTATVIDEFGRSRIVMQGPLDAARLERIALIDGYRTEIRLGIHQEVRISLADEGTFSAGAAAAAELVTGESAQDRVRTARDLATVLAEFDDDAQAAEVVFTKRCWVRSVEVLERLLATDWALLARAATCTEVEVGGQLVQLVPHGGVTGNATTYAPVGPRPEGAVRRAWECFAVLADTTAWLSLATKVELVDGRTVVHLHADDVHGSEVTLDRPSGALALLQWLTAEPDPNREEALRHVLRLATAPRTDGLPDPRNVKALAERQRIALAKDRAAEVHKAIAEGQRGTSDALEKASEGLADLVDDTAKSSAATIVAVLGLVTLLVRTADELPSYLVWLSALAVIGGIVVSARAKLQRVDDGLSVVHRHRERLKGDPFLPPDDLRDAETMISSFGTDRRVAAAKRSILGLAATAVLVAFLAAGWVDWWRSPPQTSPESTTTSSSSSSKAPPTTTTTTAPTTTTSSTTTTQP